MSEGPDAMVLVHFHLRDGGVREVIYAQAAALRGIGWRVALITGDQAVGDRWHRSLPNLDYDGVATPHLRERFHELATQVLGTSPQLVHFHNPRLGRSCGMERLMTELIASEMAMFVQHHDFAEDHRPRNRVTCGLPIGPRIHHACMNRADLATLRHAGIPPDQISLLRNPAAGSGACAPVPDDGWVLVPQRGIRRKNLGEILLWSCLTGERIAITRAPRDAAALANWVEWEDFSRALGLSLEFGVIGRIPPQAGMATDFDAWKQGSASFLSTAVSEGYGMVFQDGPLCGRVVLGRAAGAALEIREALGGGSAIALYRRMWVPTAWISKRDLEIELAGQVSRMRQQFRLPELTSEERAEAISAIWDTDADAVDFGGLPEHSQRQVIERVRLQGGAEIDCEDLAGKRCSAIGWWRAARRGTVEPETQRLAARGFSAHNLAVELDRHYHRLISASSGGERNRMLPASVVLEAFQRERDFLVLALPASLPRLPAPRRITTFRAEPLAGIRAVVFDVYGTLVSAAAGGMRADSDADARLAPYLAEQGCSGLTEPTRHLAEAIVKRHRLSAEPFPEVDLRELWQEVLNELVGPGIGPVGERWVQETEALRHPAELMPGVIEMIRELDRRGLVLGLLSNAQCDVMDVLAPVAASFADDLRVFSFQFRIAKPDQRLFLAMRDRLARRGVSAAEVLMVGNDPRSDLEPARQVGFQSARFVGDPASFRPGECAPDFVIHGW